MNSSNSSKKEKINNSPGIRNITNTKKTIMVNNLKSNINNNGMNISTEILTTILKGIISLKKNDIFDYIIKMLKLILFYYKDNNSNINKNINNFIYEFNIDDNIINLLYQNIFQVFNKETLARKILMNDFNNSKKIFRNIHCVFILYIYCGIEHINEIIAEVNKNENINNYLDYNEILNILIKFINNEQCHSNKNNDICILCQKLNKSKENLNININNDIKKNNNSNINNRKSSLNINEKKVFDNNRKNLKNNLKIKKNISNFINSDISLKLLKSTYTIKSTKNKTNISHQNIANNSNDKRILNYLKTTIDDKIKINYLNSHRDFEAGKKDQIYTELKNYITYKNNNTKNNNKSAKKIYNYSYKNNILNINTNKNNIKENISLQNYIGGKNKKIANKKKKNHSNININNNHHIFLYPKVEQYLNNVYIINDNKNINPKIFKDEKNTDTKPSKEENENNANKSENGNNMDILYNMEIIKKQINSMENIFDKFKIQTMQIKQQMMEIGKK